MAEGPSAAQRWTASLIASGVAELCTLPLDVTKTRLQVAGKGGFAQTLASIYREEGAKALWKGLLPALVRQTCYTSLSMIIYQPLRDALSGGSGPNHTPSFAVRLAAGGTAGAAAIFVFNWTEVIKTQIQTSKVPVGILPVVKRIYGGAGILGFWAGWRPNVARTFIVNAAELGSYDQIKSEFFVPWVGDNPLAHIGASGAAGVISASCSAFFLLPYGTGFLFIKVTPVDVVKTRLMNASGRGGPKVGFVRLGLDILANEGVGALYSGFTPICIRKVAWCTVFFVGYEQGLKLLVKSSSSSSS